jgi:glyoxalase/bleomycin resistance protein/dioxygenase superfamily protein
MSGQPDTKLRGASSVADWLEEQWLVARESWSMDIDVWVKDLHATAASFTERFGLGPWKYSELKAPVVQDVLFRGDPADLDMLAAVCEVGPVAIELLQVRGGSQSVMRWAEELPDGYWHPVAYHATVEAADAAFADFEKRGFETVLSGRIADSNFYMLDASGLLGSMIEIAGGPLGSIEWTADAGAVAR